MKHSFSKIVWCTFFLMVVLMAPAMVAGEEPNPTTGTELTLDEVMRLAAEQSMDVLSASQ